jgi:protein-tyrosine-phosphatase
MLVGLENELDLGRHRARQLTAEIVTASDLILVMGPHHLDRVEALGGAGKSFLLADFASHGRSQAAVVDPFGGDLEAYRATILELDEQIGRVFDRLAAEQDR